MQARFIGGVCLVSTALISTGADRAAVFVTTERESVYGLPGFTGLTLTAVSDNPAEPILGFDFSGHPDNNDPATGLGFFGPMRNFGGGFIFFPRDYFGLFEPPPELDSHFLANQSAVILGPSHVQEGPNLLQGVWAFPDPQGLSVSFAYLVIPNSPPATVNYRGQVLVGESGNGVVVDLIGSISVPEPCSLLMAVGATIAIVGAWRRQNR